MKIKTSLVTIVLLALISGLALCANINIRSKPALTNTFFTSSYDQAQLELKGTQVGAAQNYVFYLDNMAGYNQVDFYVTAVSSGNITTASMQPVYSDEVTMGETHAATLTSGTDLTDFKSQYYKMTINNPVGITINITANILITK